MRHAPTGTPRPALRDCGAGVRIAAAAALAACAVPASGQTAPCCLPNGGCEETDLFACAGAGGQWLAGLGCDDCPERVGACCLEPGGCALLDVSDSASCAVMGGAWQGPTSTCVDCFEVPPACGAGAGGCFEGRVGPGCDEAACCALVCATDAFCCAIAWDASCAMMAEEACGAAPGAVAADLAAVSVHRGTLLSGDLESLAMSDNDRLRVRSIAFDAPPVRHAVDLRIVAEAPAAVERLDLLVEVGVNAAVDVRLFLRDFGAGAWRRVDRYQQTEGDTARRVRDVESPARFVRGDGRVLLRVLTRHPSSHVARFDRVSVTVVPSE